MTSSKHIFNISLSSTSSSLLSSMSIIENTNYRVILIKLSFFTEMRTHGLVLKDQLNQRNVNIILIQCYQLGAKIEVHLINRSACENYFIYEVICLVSVVFIILQITMLSIKTEDRRDTGIYNKQLNSFINNLKYPFKFDGFLF